MKVRLPNPTDYDNVDGFLEQLELSIYHTKKSWEKIKKSLDPDAETPYVIFRVSVLQDNYEKYYDIIDNQKEQEIDIEINTP